MDNYKTTIDNIITILQTHASTFGVAPENIIKAGVKADLNISPPFIYIFPVPGKRLGLQSPILEFDFHFIIGSTDSTSADAFESAYSIASKLNAIIDEHMFYLRPADIPIELIDQHSDVYVISCNYTAMVTFYATS